MDWFYVVKGERVGPVDDSQLNDLLRLGSISTATLVWRDGMPDWQPLTVARGAVPPLPGAPASCVCAECGRALPQEEAIRLHNTWVCAQCKPVFMQRLSEGAALPSAGGLWRDKRRVVTTSETTFPDRCLKCNSPAHGFRLKRTVYWQHPAYYLLLLINLLILIIVVLIVRKKAVLHIGLCERHRAVRKQGLIIGWSSFALGLILIGSGAFASSGWMALAGVVLLLVGGIYGAVRARTVAAAKIDKQYVWVTGCHRDFLAELPEWSEP